MMALLSRRLRQWMILAVAVPLGAKAIQMVGAELEKRRGSSTLSSGLQRGGGWVQEVARGRRFRPSAR
jgi:hypothetical protein